ncbi:MAG: acyl-CoA dehydrogenase family protein [Halofilum sp. (in: g-proteobacteria)]|nr:acyl-CoA dehydrogenase family protein [Halofilum sp. (in: g-proteobacteria)]
MEPEILASPAALLARWRGQDALSPTLADYEAWWRAQGQAISATVDRHGTPALRMFDRLGQREEAVLYPPDYRRMLLRGYAAGVVARAAEEDSLLPGYRLGYVASFFDPGLYCPYTVSLGTLVPLLKYGDGDLRDRFVPLLTRRDDGVWQGATWMTESGSGSDLGRHVHTVARPAGDRWALTGEKYFCSNVDAELAVVAARPEGARDGVRGLALFLVPRWREDGALNVRIRRLKDKIATRSVPTGEVELDASEGWLLGEAEQGIYLIMEVLNTSRVANSIGSVALLQRALAEADTFARGRELFGRALRDQPLFDKQLAQRLETLRGCFALAWEAADLLESVWRETPPYSERYHLFRLVAHLAKYHTAEQAIRNAQWCMEAHGGAGAMIDYGIERLLREAMILAIWEGTPHRQMLDGLEVMKRQRAHELLFAHLGEPEGTDAQRSAVESLLESDDESGVEPVFRGLAEWSAGVLARQRLSRAGH